jgi:hypothetical protein
MREGCKIYIPKLTSPTGDPNHLVSTALLNKIPTLFI